MKNLPKIIVSDFDPTDKVAMQKLIVHVKEKVKRFVLKKNDKFLMVDALIESRICSKKFFEFRHVCMNCGTTHEDDTYVIAQTAQGHKIIHTCDCGHKIVLPQILN